MNEQELKQLLADLLDALEQHSAFTSCEEESHFNHSVTDAFAIGCSQGYLEGKVDLLKILLGMTS